MTTKNTKPITTEEEVAKHADNKIDQDFKNFPHAQANPKIIKPETEEEKKTAATNIKDGEKINYDEQRSDGSGGAFTATEDVEE